MKLTFDVDDIVDNLLAHSAITHAVKRFESSQPASVLTLDHRHALRRIVVTAAATALSSRTICGLIASLTLPDFPLPGEAEKDRYTVAVEFKDGNFADVDQDIVSYYLSEAIKAASSALLSLACGEMSRHEAFNNLMRSNIATLAKLNAPRPTPFRRANSFY